MITHVLTYLLAFVGIWVGSGLAVKSVIRLSTMLGISSFVISFAVLGIFTSMSELSVGINSILQQDPEIYVGNLIGASIVLFMLTIPLLALVGKSIRITHRFRGFNLLASLVVVALPVILVMDGKVGKTDSIIAISLFGFLLASVEVKKDESEKMKKRQSHSMTKISRELLKIVFGLAVIFVASRFVVEQTQYFSHLLNIPPFLISLLLISIGTNIPELSLIMRSAFMHDNQVAFGGYVGSAAFNTFLLGLLTLVYGKPVLLVNSYLISLLFLIVGLVAFYYFARTKNSISQVEGLAMLGLYALFITTEILLHKDVVLP